MANLLNRKKKGIAIFGCIISIALYFIRTEALDYRSIIIWYPDSTLYESDFIMTDPIFETVFDARIWTGVQIYNVGGYPKAKAIVDRHQSWVKGSPTWELLNHEKYHANISSIFAQRINLEILNQGMNFQEAKYLAGSMRPRLSEMQKDYDSQTNHSVNKPLQHYWEFKIDSLINTSEIFDTLDFYSGAHAYFPDKPEVFIQKDTFRLYKVYQLQKYRMKFRFITQYDMYVDTAKCQEKFVNFLQSVNFTEIVSNETSWKGHYMLETQCLDTLSDVIFHDRLIFDGKHEYQLTVYYPETENDSIYLKMKDRFFDSFSISNQEKYWMDRLEERSQEEMVDVTIYDKNKKGGKAFTTLPYSDYSILYHRPVVIDDHLIIPFKSIKHDPNDMHEVLLIVNEERIFSQKPDSAYQIVKLNLSELKEGSNSLQFGYIAKSDSTRESYHMYRSHIYNYSASSSLKEADFMIHVMTTNY